MVRATLESDHHLIYDTVNLIKASPAKLYNMALLLLYGLSLVSLMILTIAFEHRKPFTSSSSMNIFLIEKLKLNLTVYLNVFVPE